MAEIVINSQFRLNDNNPLDARLESVANIEALKNINRNQRYIGMTVLVEDTDGEGTRAEYWLPNGINDSNWVKKNAHIDCGEF